MQKALANLLAPIPRRAWTLVILENLSVMTKMYSYPARVQGNGPRRSFATCSPGLVVRKTSKRSCGGAVESVGVHNSCSYARSCTSRRPVRIAAKRTIHSKASGVAAGLRMMHEVHQSFLQGLGYDYLSGEIPRGNTDQNALLIDFKRDILVGVEPSP